LKKSLLFTLSAVVTSVTFQGCIFFNDRGVSSTYYNDCTHYYDSRGIYHNRCEENIVDYKEIGTVVKTYKGEKSFYIDF
jgi:hypothetical protein